MEATMQRLVQHGGGTITDRLRVHAVEARHKVAYTFLRDDGREDSISFGSLYDEALALAAVLLQHAEPGTRAVLLYPSGLEFVKAYLACFFAGIVAVPSSLPRKTRPSLRLTAIIEDAEPALVLSTDECMKIVRAACQAEGRPAYQFLATESHGMVPVPRELPAIHPDSVAFLQYTSGSTGTPHGVEVTHGNIVSNVRAIEKAFAFSSHTIMVGWLPLFHDMGLIGSVLAPLHVGFHSVLMSPSAFLKNPASWLDAASRFRATCVGAPNFGWDYCVQKIDESKKTGLDLSSLVVAYNGSEPIRATTLERFHEAFKSCGMREEALFPCYGMAETTLLVSGGPVSRVPVVLSVSRTALEGNQIRICPPDGEDAHQIVSSGAVSQDMTVLIVDPETCLPCSKRRVGEIWIKGPSVAKGYWNRPEATKQTFHAFLAESGEGPYLRSGDLGFLQNGELFITGRSKDLIVINGRNIYPQDIEQVIEQSIDFVEPNMCAAFSVDADDRETLAIVAEANRSLIRAVQLEQRDAGTKSDRALVKNAYLVRLEELAGNICSLITEQFGVTVSSIAFVKPGTFPRTSSGKVQRVLCKQMGLRGQLDIVYIMPDSIFERRLLREPAVAYQHVLFNRRQPREVPPIAAPDTIDHGPGAAEPAAPVLHRGVEEILGSRQRADAMISWFRTYAERRLNSRLIDERRTVPPYVVLDLGNHGFFGLQAPLAAGGQELSTTDLLRVIEQVAGVDLTIALLVGVHNGLGMRPVQRFGSTEMVQQLLPDLATGRRLAGFALTEPCAGSNPTAMQATAVKSEGGWIVNAEKQWIGIGSWAGVLTVFAKGVDAGGMPLGVVALILPEDSPGITQGPESMTMGMRGIVQNTVYLRDVFAPDSAVLGLVGSGMQVAQDAMMFCRLGIGAMSLGAMKRCAQLMARYASSRTISTGLLIDNAVTLAALEVLTSSILATESLVYEIANLADRSETIPDEAYIAVKTAGPEFLGEAADLLIQLLGGRGYVETNGAPQIFRDARVLRVFEGPTETLHMHLGAGVLRQSDSIMHFLSGTLQAPDVARLLMTRVAEVVALASRKTSLFADAFGAEQWTNFQVGRLATAAMVLAAAGKAKSLPHSDDQADRAIAWAARHFTDLHCANLGWFGDDHTGLSRDAMLGVIDRYALSIGDVEQQLAGEGQEVDALLRRGGANSLTIPAGSSAVTAPAVMQIKKRDADQVRMDERLAMPKKAAPSNAGQRQARADEGAATRQNIASIAVGNPVTTGSRQRTVESVINWLRTEKQRTVNELGDEVCLTSLGMDSLGAVTLSLELERRTGVDVTPDIIFECQTIGRLAAYIAENSPVDAKPRDTAKKRALVL